MDGSIASVLPQSLRLGSTLHQIPKVHGHPLHTLHGVRREKRSRSLGSAALLLAILAGEGDRGGAAIRPLPDRGVGVEGAG